MTIVAGVDFGTLSVRVSIMDSEQGRLGTAVAEYPLHRKREDPDYATQAHADQMRALAEATRAAVKSAGVQGEQIAAIALDTTGSSVVPVDARMQPLDEYYLWCDHRAKSEAQEITALAHEENLEAIEWCGGVYSHEWGFAKLLHWLRHNPDKRGAVRHRLRALRHGGGHAVRHHRSSPGEAQRLRDGPQVDVEPQVGRISAAGVSVQGRSAASTAFARNWPASTRPRIIWPATLLRTGPTKLGLQAGIPIPVGAFDAHWDALGAGCREGDVVNVVGTSTCIIAMAQEDRTWSPACAASFRAACIRSTPASKPACPRPATSSMPSRAAPA